MKGVVAASLLAIALVAGMLLGVEALRPVPGRAVARTGAIELRLMATQSVYLTGEQVAVRATLTYLGPDRATSIWYIGWAAVDFGIAGRPSGVLLQMRGRWPCEEQVLERGVPVEIPMINRADGEPWVELPADVWEVSAMAAVFGEACRSGPATLEATAQVEVRGDLAVPMIDLATPHELPTACAMAAGGGWLVRDQVTGLGVTDEQHTRIWRVRWPYGFTAHIRTGVAELIDPTGSVVAREGDHVRFGGGWGTDHVFRACGEVTRLPPDTPS